MRLQILLFCAILWAQGYAQTFSVDARRIEVTARLDRQIDPALVELLAPYQAAVDSLRKPLLGYCPAAMSAERPESPLSNWVSDALRAHADSIGHPADIGLYNMGGIRSNLPAGPVTRGDILEMAPFENRFCLLTLRGSDLLDLFAQIAHSRGEGISGAQLDISTDGRLLRATVGGQPVEDDRPYTIATIDYLAGGNDGLVALKNALSCDVSEELVRDVLIAQVRQQGTLTAAIEGRITIDGQHARQQAGDIGGSTSLLIVHTNDTHSCVEPINPHSADRQRAGKAGYLRRAALIEDLRAEDPDLLLFDCGDISQGSAYYTLFRGEVEFRLMNAMGYDAATIGNHEFDYGLENMATLFRGAQFPIVCANYDFGATSLASLVRPYVVLERKGLRIGVFGLGAQLDGLVATENYAGITYLDPIDAANNVVRTLREDERCDLVVCLSHLGWDTGLIDGTCDQDLVAHTRGIDILLGGHSHTYFEEPIYVNNLDGVPVPCNQMGKNGQWVGTLRLTIPPAP